MTSAAVDAIEIEALQLNVANAATTAGAVDRKGSSDRGGSVALAVGSSTEGTVTCVQIDLLLTRRIETEAVLAGGGGSIHKVAVLDLVRKKEESCALWKLRARARSQN